MLKGALHLLAKHLCEYRSADAAASQASDVNRAKTAAQNAMERLLDPLRFQVQAEGVAQHHGRAQDRTDGIRRIGPGERGRGAVNGLKQWSAGAKTRRRYQANRPDQGRGGVTKDVAKHVGREYHVELGRAQRELHGRVVYIHMFEADVRVGGASGYHGAAPELRTG